MQMETGPDLRSVFEEYLGGINKIIELILSGWSQTTTTVKNITTKTEKKKAHSVS